MIKEKTDGKVQSDPTVRFNDKRTLLLEAVLEWSWNRENELDKMAGSREIIRMLVEAGADPTIPDEDGDSPISLVAGYHMPGINYSRDHSSGWLHQLISLMSTIPRNSTTR